MRHRALLFCCFVLALFLLPVYAARADDRPRYGTIEAEQGGHLIQLPSLKTDISADIEGDLATVTVVQTFANPGTEPLHATYLFPLNHDAAVYDMLMELGQERVRAVIQEKQQAQATFDKARSEGKVAALLTEHRPNMFTQKIANLMPGVPVKVTLRYVQTVPKIDGEYEMVVPLIVGPRFQPPQAPAAATEKKITEVEAQAPAPGVWELAQAPEYPHVNGLDLPPAVEPERVSLKVHLNGGMPIRQAQSATHALVTQAKSASVWDIGLAQGRVIDNRDFVLRYALGGATTQAGVLSQIDDRGGFLSLLIEPPALPAADDMVPREMVFLLDCSGSMSGTPLEASKSFMRKALTRLRANDTFRIIRFGDDATEYSDVPLPATADNIARAIVYTNGLRGQGGTMVETGIRQALTAPPAAGRQRIVTFLTDGYIGNDYSIIGLLHQLIGDSRLYALGVGTGVNRFFLDEVGRVGRGFTRYMDPTENVDAVAEDLAARLQSPVLTNISIDWNELDAAQVSPAALPDLFAGQSLRVQARYTKPGDYLVRITGQAGRRVASILLPVHLPAKGGDGAAVPLVWARAAVKESMYQMSLPPVMFRDAPGAPPSYEQLKAFVTRLGLDFSIVTQWTSFVAVSEKVYNTHPEAAQDAQVPLPMVKGVTALAYGQNAPAFTGASGPEAGSWAGLLLMFFMLAALLRYRRAAPAGRLA